MKYTDCFVSLDLFVRFAVYDHSANIMIAFPQIRECQRECVCFFYLYVSHPEAKDGPWYDATEYHSFSEESLKKVKISKDQMESGRNPTTKEANRLVEANQAKVFDNEEEPSIFRIHLNTPVMKKGSSLAIELGAIIGKKEEKLKLLLARDLQEKLYKHLSDGNLPMSK